MKTKLLLGIATSIALTNGANAQVSISTVNTYYAQDFDLLATTGTANAANTLPAGWVFSETGGNTTYEASGGSSSTGGVHSFGSAASTERALGSITTSSITPVYFGASFANNTGVSIHNLSVAYKGEQWQKGGGNVGPDSLSFQYSTNATSLTDGSATWTTVSALAFNSIYTGAGGAQSYNGSLFANSTKKSHAITGLNIPSNATFWIRWTDEKISTGNDNGMGVDSFRIATNVGTSYYPRAGSTDLNNVANWTSDVSGGAGTSPINFTSPSQYFYVNNNITNPTYTGDWIISGGSIVIVTNPNGIVANPFSMLKIGTGSTFNLQGNKLLLEGNHNNVRKAMIGNIQGTLAGATNVTMEWPVNTFYVKRAWRLLAVPFQAATAPTILNSWQEGVSGGNPNSGFGTWVSSADPAAVSNGFDGVSNSTSIQYWNGTAYVTPANTNVTKVTDHGAAWMLFVRGDKSANTYTSPPNTTKLRVTGTPNQGNITAGVAGSSWSLIPNPYPCNVDYEAVYTANGSPATLNNYYIWDFTLGTIGGYRTVTRVNATNYVITPATSNVNGADSASNRYIYAGSSFYLNANTTLNFTENMKAVTSSVATPPFFFPQYVPYKTTSALEELVVNLSYDNGDSFTLADGFRVWFDGGYTNTPSAEDVVKLENNYGENLSVTNTGGDYVIEKLAPVAGTETVQLRFWKTALRDYKLTFMPKNLTQGTKAFLVDAYTNTSTLIADTGTTEYLFSVTNDAGTWNPLRFRIVFNNTATAIPEATSPVAGITVFPNPVQGKTLHIDFKGMKEGVYNVTLTSMTGAVVKTVKLQHKGNSTYTVTIPESLAAGVYNVKVVDAANNQQYNQELIVR
ncbi:MAG TPA: T9SS type A sorting domain-containing protein [Flavipsychrobacter sp.]|nr:T9SS type A sorting domain-containing protein [Flavipsychrobacter sp.]